MSSETKKTNLIIEFSLPENEKIHSISLNEKGLLVVKREDGSEITPIYTQRALSHERTKGPKIRTRSKLQNSTASFGGLEELRKFSSIFLIDTNTKIIKEKHVSVACFICCRVILRDHGYQFEFENKLNFYEFQNALEKPERLAILKIVNDIQKTSDTEDCFAIVTDTELGLHDAINNKKAPIYKNTLLPDRFTLLYASADTGREFLNQLFKCCDKEANKYIDLLDRSAILDKPFSILEENNDVLYRYMCTSDIEIKNHVIPIPSIPEGTQVSLYGIKSERNT